MSKKVGKEVIEDEHQYLGEDEEIDSSDTIVFSKNGIIRINTNEVEEFDDKKEIKMYNKMLKREEHIMYVYRELIEYTQEHKIPLLDKCTMGDFLDYIEQETIQEE